MEIQNILIASFLIFLSLKVIIQIYLSFLQEKYVGAHRMSVPSSFAEKITLSDHQKAADYTKANIGFSRLTMGLHLLLLLFWTVGGGVALLHQYIPQGLLLIVVFSLINMLLGIPEDLYQTFVLEEKFGFNKTTLKIYIMDFFKQTLLSAIIGLPLLWILLSLMDKMGSNWWLYAFAVLTSFQFIMMWLYPVLIAPLFNKFTPLEDGPIKDKVMDLLSRVEFSYNKDEGLFVMDASKRSSHGNAYFTGFGKNKRIVFFDILLKNLEADEVASVLAHELGHFKRHHIKKMLVFSIFSSFLGFALLGFLSKQIWFYQAFGIQEASPAVMLLLFTLIMPAFTFFITPISAHFSRKHEFEADDFAAKYAKASSLISALTKLYKDNASTLTPHPSYSRFYYSHPPALERVAHLEQHK